MMTFSHMILQLQRQHKPQNQVHSAVTAGLAATVEPVQALIHSSGLC
jgi:hypothetical protein